MVGWLAGWLVVGSIYLYINMNIYFKVVEVQIQTSEHVPTLGRDTSHPGAVPRAPHPRGYEMNVGCIRWWNALREEGLFFVSSLHKVESKKGQQKHLNSENTKLCNFAVTSDMIRKLQIRQRIYRNLTVAGT